MKVHDEKSIEIIIKELRPIKNQAILNHANTSNEKYYGIFIFPNRVYTVL